MQVLEEFDVLRGMFVLQLNKSTPYHSRNLCETEFLLFYLEEG
jgi:hypothetical protein